MSDLLGFTALALVSLITLILCIRWPKVSKILFVALLIRVFILLIGHYVTPLPDSSADSVSFEKTAWNLAQKGFFNLSEYYQGPDSRFISWLLAIPYSLLGRSVLMAKSISLFFGVGSVFLGWKLANKIWGLKIANSVGWLIALFPSLILYSALIMREAYISFFLLVAIYGVVNWVKNESYGSILLALAGFTCATFFHGASILGAMTFILIASFYYIVQTANSLKKFQIKFSHLLLVILFSIVMFLYFSGELYFPYIKNIDFITNPDTFVRKTRVSVMGGAAYPEWTIAKSPIELIYKVPARSIYFLFSPFLWDVKEIKHLIGSVDGFLYICLVVIILRNYKVIWRDPCLRIILLILATYIIAFSIGVGNFGTGIRHRSKFTIMFILLAAPLIHRFVILNNSFFKKLFKLSQ